MPSKRKAVGALTLLLLGMQAGCLANTTHDRAALPSEPTFATPEAAIADKSAQRSEEAVVRLSAAEPLADPQQTPLGASPFEGQAELQVDALITAVLTRNPTLAQMTAAWQAASARYPQVTSLDDPIFNAALGPASIDSRDVRFAYRLEIAQKYPWPGKRALRGANALAEASAAGHDIEDVRLQLVESTRTAFYDYYLVERALEVNAEALRLLEQFRANALERFRNRLAPEQDFRQADVEMGRQRERQVSLERMKQVAIARINTLMNLPTSTPLPPPPKEIPTPPMLPDVRELQARALAQRPDLRALAERIAAEKASLALAYKEYYPDLEPYFMYDRFMGNLPEERDLAPQLGVRVNLPVRKSRRAGAVAEAHARLAQRQAELARQTNQVHLQVEEAYQQVRESERSIQLYHETILPAARQNVKAAITAYTTGRIPFLSLIEAERNLIGLRDRFYETSADIFRRRATLERVTGGPLIPAPFTPPQERHDPRLLAPPAGNGLRTLDQQGAGASPSTPSPTSRDRGPEGK